MLENVLAQGSFILLNKVIVQKLGLHEAIMIGELFTEYKYYQDNELLQPDGSFFSTRENIEENTGLSSYQQRVTLKRLIDLDLISTETKGIPAKTYYWIHEEKIIKVLNDKSLKNFTTRDKKITQQDAKKLHGNNNNNNNKKKNNNKKNNSREVSSRKSKDEKYIDKVLGKLEEYDFSDKVVNKIIEFYEDRIEKKDYPADNQLTMTLDKLAGVSESKQINALNNSISNGYKGIFVDNKKQEYDGIHIKDPNEIVEEYKNADKEDKEYTF